jgi:hypothetical protein
MYVLGSLASADAIDRYSGPTTINEATHRVFRNPSKRPRWFSECHSAKDPGFFQYRNPYGSRRGFAPTIVRKVKAKRMNTRITLKLESQNSASPYNETANTLSKLHENHGLVNWVEMRGWKRGIPV